MIGKTYIVARKPEGVIAFTLNGNRRRELDPRFDLRNHSPDGFNFGYGGSGPAQLALALLADALGDDNLALKFYQKLKFDFVAGITEQSFSVTQAFLRARVRQYVQTEKIRHAKDNAN